MATAARALSARATSTPTYNLHFRSQGQSFNPSHIVRRAYSKKFSRGDIVTFQGKFEGEGGDVVHSKNRPNIVISAEKVMEVTHRVALAPLSTAPARHEYEVVIPSDEKTKLKNVSKVMANQIRTVAIQEALEITGSASQHLPAIDRALAISFGDYKVRKNIAIARGDVVEIDFGNLSRSGIIVSNDIGNRASQIAMLAHSHKKHEKMNEFDLLVKTLAANELLVQCYMINTFPQGLMGKTGRITDKDLERITDMLFKTIGIKKN